MKLQKKLNLEEAEKEIILIEDLGHSVERFTDWHWRIDGKIDLFPTTKKFMGVKEKKVKTYNKIIDIFEK